MAKKRARILSTKNFSLVIAAFVIAIFIVLSNSTGLLRGLEFALMDRFFALKIAQQNQTLQEGSVFIQRNPKVSSDIVIVGIDSNTLFKYGKWPFPRWRHADLLNAFSRIKNQGSRENSVLLDILFPDPNERPQDDEKLSSAIKNSGRVILETELRPETNITVSGEAYAARQSFLMEKYGSLKNISGDWKKIPPFFGAEPPLQPFIENLTGYGHPNFLPDIDNVFRRQILLGRLSREVEQIPLDSLVPGFNVDQKLFERLAWMDTDGAYHNIPTPLTAQSITLLKSEMQARAPKKVSEDELGAAANPDGFYIVRKYQDYFLPSVTLALAAKYFGRELSDIQIDLGKRVRIPNPRIFDPATGEWNLYSILVEPEKYDKEGNLIKPGIQKILSNIDIPIDDQGQMLINFMGPPSSDSPEGNQVYTIRSYAGYADLDPGPDKSKWNETLALDNKILMIGAFASGMAADQKTTPFGLMFGIEMHANALNTIIMNNFLNVIPNWVKIVILLLLVFLTAFSSSRLPTWLALIVNIVFIAALFFADTIVFEELNLMVDISTPSLAMIFTFVSIVVYRVMTEERDKRRIRETFGKYLSPDLVKQLADNPPELGGVDKELSVMFSDIRGFTSISERLSPQELINHLNDYLTAMTDIVYETRGTLDKYIGDAIMAFWGAPLDMANHAEMACDCALKQMKKLHELNALWPEHLRLNIGIGINSGIMTVGNMGSPTRLSYTLAGDNVNLGSRLEGTNKEYGTNIIISEATWSLVEGKFIVRELDNIRVKGKNKPVLIFELIDRA